ncbi:MAG: helix-turn-helix domain-containing protein [Enterococcus sp.]|nr:helix-turn-helix domain-containing protein [Enterococcus sp.]
MTEQIEEVPAELIQTRVYELRPNETMRRVLDEACDYRRYCWNQGLALWNEMYKARQALKSSLASDSKKLTEEQKVLLKEKPSPSERRVRNMLVADKKDWQYTQSARILQLAISDLGKAWNNFFDKAQPGWGKPQFRSKREARQGFKSDRSKIKDGILYLERARGSRVPKDQWRGFKLSEKPLSDEFGVVSYFTVITLPSRIRSRLKMLSRQTKQVKLPRLTSMLVTLITRVAG